MNNNQIHLYPPTCINHDQQKVCTYNQKWTTYNVVSFVCRTLTKKPHSDWAFPKFYFHLTLNVSVQYHLKLKMALNINLIFKSKCRCIQGRVTPCPGTLNTLSNEIYTCSSLPTNKPISCLYNFHGACSWVMLGNIEWPQKNLWLLKWYGKQMWHTYPVTPASVNRETLLQVLFQMSWVTVVACCCS